MTTELKTLKEMRTKFFASPVTILSDKTPIHWGEEGIELQDLRAEAIRWVKHFDEDRVNYTTGEKTGATATLMKFFNLTEEDVEGDTNG